MNDEELTYCPGCDLRILPGQSVVGVKDEDPRRGLWHAGCRKIWEYDERLGAQMSGESDSRKGARVQEFSVGDVVILKSGGPNMTITEIDDGKATCIWAAEYGISSLIQRYVFPLPCLKPAPVVLKDMQTVQA